LNQPRQIDTRTGSNEQMDVRPEEGERDNRDSLLNRGAPEEAIEEFAGRGIDHWHSAMRRPREMEVDLMGSHSGDSGTRDSTRVQSSHSEEWAQ